MEVIGGVLMQQTTKTDIDLMLRCAKRELNKRQWFYPKWIKSGKITQEQADFEILGMQKIVKHFEFLQIYGMPEQQKLF